MAQYEARQRELYARYTALIGTIPFEEVNRILAGLQAHARLRDEALVELGNIAADHDERLRHEDFTNRVEERRKAVVGALDTLLDSVREPSLAAMRFRDLAVFEENLFFTSLKALQPAKARDAQWQLTQALDKLAKELKAKWSQLSDTERTLLERERYAALKMRQTLQKVVEDMVEGPLGLAKTVTALTGAIEQLRSKVNSDYEAAVQEASRNLGVNEELSAIVTSQFKPGGLVAKAFYAGLTALFNPIVGGGAVFLGVVTRSLQPYLDSALRDATAELRSQLMGSTQVAFVFSDTRRQANEYLSTSGYDQGKDNYTRASEALSEWASGQNGALKTEAEAWAAVANTGIAYFLELMRVIHADMLSQFGGIFMNDLSDKTVNALCDRPFFLDWDDGIARLDFDEKLKSLRAQLVTLSGNLDAAFEQLKVFDRLPRDVQDLLQAQVQEVQSSLKQPMTEAMQEALRTLDAAQARPVRDTLEELRQQQSKLSETLLRAR